MLRWKKQSSQVTFGLRGRRLRAAVGLAARVAGVVAGELGCAEAVGGKWRGWVWLCVGARRRYDVERRHSGELPSKGNGDGASGLRKTWPLSD